MTPRTDLALLGRIQRLSARDLAEKIILTDAAVWRDRAAHSRGAVARPTAIRSTPAGHRN